MNGRANTGLLVAAVTSGIVLAVLATAVGSDDRHSHRSIACNPVTEAHAEPQLSVFSIEHTRSSARPSSASPAVFAAEPAFGAEIMIIAVDENDHPVPGAVLRILEPDQGFWDFVSCNTAFEKDPLGVVRRTGTLVECDELGRARIPRPMRHTAVLASAGELDAFCNLYPGTSSPWMVTLETQHVLNVRVRNEQGEPVADLPLELHEQDADFLWRGSTDKNGRAVIDSLAFALRWPDDVIVLTAAIPVDPPIERWLPGDLSSKGVVELVIPGGSTTTVRIVDARGQVLDVNDKLTIHLPEGRARANCETGRIRVPVHAGIATVHGLPRGSTALLVTTSHVAEMIAPLPNGEWGRTIDVPIDADYELVRMTVANSLGRPLAQRLLDWRGWDSADGETEDSCHGEGRVMTDAHGEMSCFVRFPKSAVARRGINFFELIDPAACPPLRTKVDVEEIRESDPTVRYGIRLHPAPIALSGRVLDGFGMPVVDASIDLRALTDGNDGRRMRTFADVFTDTQGRFTAYALPVSAPIRVEVEVDGCEVTPDEPVTSFAFGTRDLDLRVNCLGTIEGRLLVDAESRDLCFEVEASQGEFMEGDFDIWSEGPEFHWRLRSLALGTYQLRVLADGEEVCTIDEVRVPDSRLVLDPRCLPIDVRGRIPNSAHVPESRVRVLHIVDTNGLPIDHGLWRYEVDGEWHDWTPWLGGEVQVFEPFERVSVWSPGSWMREGQAPGQETNWDLEPARTVELKLEIPAELRSNRFRFSAIAELEYNESNKIGRLLGNYEPALTFDSSGRAAFAIPAGNRWVIAVAVDWDASEGGDGRKLESFVIQLGEDFKQAPVALEPNVKDWLRVLRDAEAPIAPQRD